MTLRLGKYETVRAIASGGMATVYLGRALSVGGFERYVAIKAMHPHIALEKAYVEMFLDEARLAARIRHPNVVPVIDVEQSSDGVPFIVMEFVEGPTLGQMMKLMRRHKDALPVGIALKIMCDVLSGLHAAHELKGKDRQPLHLVHRDVSPQNIMVGYDGITRITDFGVARARVRIHSTRNSEIKGKLAYIPPEQLNEMDSDRRADVYAAGVVLWEALTGHRLFKADTEARLIMRLLEGAKRTPSEVNSRVPQHIDGVVMKALSMQPELRWASAMDFAEALEDAALAIDTRIASPRTVKEFARALPLDVTTTSDIPPPSEHEPLPDLALPPLPEEDPTRITGERSAGSLTSAAAVAASTPPRSNSRRTLIGVSIGVGLFALAGGFYALGAGGSDQAADGAAPADAPQPAAAVATAQPDEQTDDTDDADDADDTAAGAEAAESAAPSSSASVAPSADPAADKSKPFAGKPAKGWSPKPKSTAYRPDDL